MARVEGREAIYEVAEAYRRQCLIGGRSLLWPDKDVWTPANLSSLWDAFAGRPDTGGRKFLEKLRDQLADQTEDIHRIICDLVAFYWLGPSDVKAETKLRGVRAVANLKLARDLPELSFLEPAYSTGIFRPGPNYLIAGWAYLSFLLEFAKAVREGRADPTNPPVCRQLANEITGHRQHAKGARHFILHVLFPDSFESIVSDRHRRMIIKKFRDLTGGAEDPDDALLRIRRALESQYGREISFYNKEIKQRWLPDAEAEGGVKETEETGVSGQAKVIPEVASAVKEALLAPVAPNPEYSLSQCAEETGFDQETLERWVRAIERKTQAIIYGPPGTGKTYLSERLARHIVAGGDGFVEVVQFHPAYSYEDFVQGIRPKARSDGRLEYPVVPGRFLEFCERATTRLSRCVMIIDEINRANLAKVFGELMYLLEYREREVPLAAGSAFRIPTNVRIIGTMNTADRSIALVDHALRRRFAFLALEPRFDVLEKYHEETGFPVTGLISVVRSLNNEIGDPNYAVGISFFLRSELATHIEDIWRMEIEPYLEEFFFDQRGKVERFRWDQVKSRILA